MVNENDPSWGGDEGTCTDAGEATPCQEMSRRRFLGMSVATIAAPSLLGGCAGDDGVAMGGTGGEDTDVGSSSAGTSGDGSSSMGTTTGNPGSTSTGSAETSTGMDESTGDETGGETGEPTDDGGEEFPFDPDSVAEDAAMFPRTVMAGEMQASSALLAIFIEDAQPKTLRLWRDSEVEGNVVLVREEEVTPDAQGFAKVPIDGLLPGTWYSYAYFGADFESRSLIGRMRTALSASSSDPVTVALAACNGGYYQPGSGDTFDWPSMTTQSQQDYDLMIHLGDQGYMDDVFDDGGTYEMYLEAWGAYHGGGYREVYPLAGLYGTWDDHEVTDNGAVDPWSRSASDIERIENAIEAYYRVMPIDAVDSNDTLWRSFRWGQSVEFIMLDSRYERSPTKAGLYLSLEQMEWLKERLANSPCHFKVVCNSVPFTDLQPWFGIAASDRWKGYPAQRQEIIDFVNSENISNIYWVTGDIHTNFVSHIQPDPGPGAGDRMREICVTSGNSNPAALLLQGSQFSYSTGSPRTVLLTFDPGANSVHVRFLNADTGAVEHEETLVSVL